MDQRNQTRHTSQRILDREANYQNSMDEENGRSLHRLSHVESLHNSLSASIELEQRLSKLVEVIGAGSFMPVQIQPDNAKHSPSVGHLIGVLTDFPGNHGQIMTRCHDLISALEQALNV